MQCDGKFYRLERYLITYVTEKISKYERTMFEVKLKVHTVCDECVEKMAKERREALL